MFCFQPEAFVRNWQWNNSWYIAQERPIYQFGMKEAVMRRGIPLQKPEDILSDFHGPDEPVHIVRTNQKPVFTSRDIFHQ